MVIRSVKICHTELKEIQIYVKKISAVQDAAGIYVTTEMKKSVENVFHALTIVRMEFMKLFKVIHIHLIRKNVLDVESVWKCVQTELLK